MNASGDALDELVEFILKINGGLKQGQDYYPLFDHFDLYTSSAMFHY